MSGKIEQKLDQYFLPRELLAENRKSDGRLYRTWRACVKKEFWSCMEPTYVTIKEIPKTLYGVYRMLSNIHHPNLETVYDIWEDDDCCYAINEYILPPFGLMNATEYSYEYFGVSLSLEQLTKDSQGIRNLSSEERIHQALIILLQLTEALEALHAKGLIHGDIHPGNILLTDMSNGYHPTKAISYKFCVKLIDFDNTTVPKKSDHTVTRLMGVKSFAAPEILDFSHPLDKSDIYSLGCILYYVISGESPKNYAPNQDILRNKWVNRIVRRCTASYEARYRNITALKKDILRALNIPSNPFIGVLYHLPGFRSHSIWKMIIAGYVYFTLIWDAGYTFISIFQTGLPLQEWQVINLYSILLYTIEIIVLFDGFQLEERFPSYRYFKTAHPILHFFLKIAEGILIIFLFVLIILLKEII